MIFLLNNKNFVCYLCDFQEANDAKILTSFSKKYIPYIDFNQHKLDFMKWRGLNNCTRAYRVVPEVNA